MRIAFIDDDVLPTPVFAAEHLASDARHGDVVVRGAAINTASFDALPMPVWTLRNYSANWFWTTNVSVRRARLDAAGGSFDESFSEYGWEDIELGLRLRAIGTKAVFNRRAVVFHYKPPPAATSVEGMLRQARAQARTAVRLERLHPRLRVALAIGDTAPQRALGAAIARGPLRARLERIVHGSAGRRRAARTAAHRGAPARRRGVLRRARRREAVAGALMRILLSRTDRVGDLILSTPAIASVRRSFPDAHVTIACSRHNGVVVERSPDVDAVSVVPDGESPWSFGARFAGVDLAIALAPRDRDHRIVAATRAPRRVGYTYARRYVARLLLRTMLTDVVLSPADPVIAERRPERPVPHEVDQVLAVAEAAGARAIARDLVLVVDRRRPRRRRATCPPARSSSSSRGAGRSTGRPPRAACELFRELRALGRPLLATFGDDGASLGAVVERAGVADAVLGNLPFHRWAAVFERAACVLTIDTGATHVASAVRVPTVVLFEHRWFRLASQEWSPYRVPNAVLRKPPDESEAALRASRAELVAAVSNLL